MLFTMRTYCFLAERVFWGEGKWLYYYTRYEHMNYSYYHILDIISSHSFLMRLRNFQDNEWTALIIYKRD